MSFFEKVMLLVATLQITLDLIIYIENKMGP